ncbi:MAG: TonB-dependent receptor [Prevotellaceae bacterium]|jgi:TonB-linked SusC/RagA family outer membrane protein|nr:TonB-dependent receptor [Prevotellaceae bacterium]
MSCKTVNILNRRKTVFFLVALAAMFAGVEANAQEKLSLKGKVIDIEGTPLSGVSVYVEGSSLGTVTSDNGDYVLSNVPKGSVVIFQMVGYVTQKVKASEKTEINAVMQEESESLEELTIVAFGQQKKESVVSAITTISPKNLKVPSSNLTTAFAGQMAGMISYQSTGEPGADNAEFFIRGVTTFGYNVDPLILVDNIEITKTELARIQTDDIESFSLMKDAAATALYGARGANGVILVKTKEGQAGKMNLSVRIENTFSTPTRQIELADPVTYMKMHNEALVTRDRNASPLYSDDKIVNTVPGSGSLIYPATDWRKELLKDYASNQRVNLSVRGGGNIARYYVSASFSQDNGILKVDENRNNNFNQNIDLKTYTLRSNVNIDLTKTTELKVSLDGTFEDYTGPLGSGSDMYKLIMKSNPALFPAKYPIDAEHYFVKHTMFGNVEDGQYLNPYAEMVRGYRDYNKSIMGAQMEVNQKLDFIAKGLSIRALFNTKREARSEISRYYVPYYYRLISYDPYNQSDYHIGLINVDNSFGESLSTTRASDSPYVLNTMYFESSLLYSTQLADKHDIGGQLVYTMRNKTVPLTGTESRANVINSLPYRNMGLAGRLSYGYDSRYLAELNFGLNGSERFAKAHRWGFFPSVSAGWIISNEKFFEPLKKVFTLVKIRGSYGMAGNDNISDERFLYLSDVNLNSTSNAWVFGEESGYFKPGISVSRYAAPDISWEVSYKTNIALELTLLKDFVMVGEYFTEDRTKILQTRSSIPYSMGLWNPGSVRANLGEAHGKGFEFSLNYSHSFSKDFWIQARANYTYAVAKYTKYEEYDYVNEPWKRHVGTATTQQFGYIAEGLFIDDAEVANSPVQAGAMAGDIKYRDLNGDGIISDRDQTAIGYPTTPEIQYGFGPSIGWKSWDFSFFFNGVHRRSFWINYENVSPFFNTVAGSSTVDGSRIGHNALAKFIADSYWSENNRNLYAEWPRLSTSLANSQNNSYTNTWFMRDGAFLRLKQVELGYTLPEKLVQKAGMTSFRLYVTATNLFCISKFKLWDVEMAGNGLAYPIQRGFNIGINATF